MPTEAERLNQAEFMIAHLEHELQQMHEVLLAVQAELQSTRVVVTKLESRLASIAEPVETRDPLLERPPHY